MSICCLLKKNPLLIHSSFELYISHIYIRLCGTAHFLVWPKTQQQQQKNRRRRPMNHNEEKKFWKSEVIGLHATEVKIKIKVIWPKPTWPELIWSKLTYLNSSDPNWPDPYSCDLNCPDLKWTAFVFPVLVCWVYDYDIWIKFCLNQMNWLKWTELNLPLECQ